MNTQFIICTTLWLMLPAWLIAQKDTELNGYVVEWNSGYYSATGQIKKLSGVSISAPKAKPARSDDKGLFKLIFSDVEIGESVSLTIEKPGYEVVNKKDIQDLFPNRKSPVKILLCPQGTIDKNRAAYYEINLAALKKKLRDRIALLEEDGKKKEELLSELSRQMKKQISDKDEAIALLLEQFERMKTKADELSVNFSTQNLDDQSETFQQAFTYYQQGDLEKAVYFLESAKIPETLEARKPIDEKYSQKIANYQDSLRINDSLRTIEINELVFLARLQYQTLEFEKADSSYRLALHYSHNNYDILVEYAEFLYSDGRFSDAFKQFEAIFENTTTTGDSILSWYMKGIHSAMAGENELLDSQIVKLSMLLPRYKTMSACENYLLDALIHTLTAFSDTESLKSYSIKDITAFYHTIDTVKCDNLTTDIFTSIKGVLGIYLLSQNINDTELRNYYSKKIESTGITDKRVSFIVNILQYTQLAKFYLYSADWNNLDSAFIKLDNIYSQADTTLKRMAKTTITSMYIEFGQELLNLGLIDRSKLYFTKSTALLEQLNPDDPIERRSFITIVPTYLSLAQIHTIGSNLDVAMIRSNCEKAYSHVQALRKKQYLPDNYYWDHMWNYHYYLSLAEWYDKNTDATVAHVEPAYAYSDTLAKYDVDYAPTHVQRSTNFINLYFEYCNLPQGDRYVEPARQFAHKLIDFLRVSNLADSTKLQQFNYLNRMKLYFDNFSPKSRDYLHLLYQIFNLENQINANQYSPQNYQTSKTVISLIDKALFIKKDDAFLMQTKASHLGGLAWFSILSRNYEQAEQAAKNGLELAPSETWIYSNLAAAYLLLGKFEEAKKIYTQYADAPADPLHVRTMRTIFLNDLDQFEQMGITHKDFKKVKGLLQK